MATGTVFAYKFESDVGTFTASDTVSVAYPVSNVKNPYPGRVWRSQSGTSKWVKVDTIASISATYCFITGANFHQGVLLPTYPHIYATNDANLFGAFTTETDWINSGVDLGAMDHSSGRYAKKRFASTQSYRYWIIFFSYNVVNPPPYTEIGRIVFTSHLQMPYAHDEPWNDSLVPTSSISQSGFERLFPVGVIRPPLRKMTLNFQAQILSNTDRKNLVEMFNTVDIIKPIFVDAFPDYVNADEVHYGRILNGIDLTRLLLNNSRASLEILEVR